MRRLCLSFAFLLLAQPLAAQQGSDWTALDGIAAKAVASPELPGGSILVARGDEILYDQAFGFVDAKKTRAWGMDDPVRIASMSKPITATLVSVLVAQGLLSFDDPIAKHLPEFANLKLTATGKSIRSPTIAECLSHTAGFKGGTIMTLAKDSIFRTGTQERAATELSREGLAATPGTRYAYTFRGYAAVSRTVEVVTGRKFAAVLEEELLQPLAMTDTTFYPDADLVKRMPSLAAHAVKATEAQLQAYLERSQDREAFVNCAGALISSPDDLVRFFRLHADAGAVGERQLVPAKILARLYEKQPASPRYGLGFSLDAKRPQVVGHGGATGTQGFVDLKTGIIGVILTQAGASNARPFTSKAKTFILEKTGGERCSESPSSAAGQASAHGRD